MINPYHIIQFIPYSYLLQIELVFSKLQYLLSLPFAIYYQITPGSDKYLPYSDLIMLQGSSNIVSKEQEHFEESNQKWAYVISSLLRGSSCCSLLDVGCGDGSLVAILSRKGFPIIGIDIQPRIDQLKRGAKTYYLSADASSFPFPDDYFDFIYSINSFEHFREPEKVFKDLIRILKPGGYFFTAFSPIYYSAKGLHASRRLGFSYPQLLFHEDTIQRYLDEHSADLANTYDVNSDKTKISPYLNKYDVAQYRKLFKSGQGKYQILTYIEKPDLSGIREIIRYPRILRKNSPSFRSLLISSIKILLQKHSGNA